MTEEKERKDKIEGIVLSSVRYGESSRIVNVLTRDEGKAGFMLRQNGKHKSGSGMLLPLSGVEFIASGGRKGGMRAMKDLSLRHTPASFGSDPVRRSEAFFIAELLCHTLPDGIGDELLYEYVENSILTLEQGIDGIANFHLYFMMHLTDYIGIAPSVERDEHTHFDLLSGEWTDGFGNMSNSISGEEAELWYDLENVALDELNSLNLNRNSRQQLIDLMQRYYSLHHPGFTLLKSQDILAMLA